MKKVKTAAKAIKFMKANGGEHAKPYVHALYLLRVPESRGFTRKDIAVYLSGLDEEDELLTTYFRLTHFGAMGVLESLRSFFTKLRLVQLPDTAQMNRLLFALATAFTGTGGRFEGDEDDLVRIYSAILMLNDSLHYKGSVGRSRMTEQRFLEFINDRDQNEVAGFGEDEMRRIYRSVTQFPLAETYPIFTEMSGPSGPQIDDMLIDTVTKHKYCLHALCPLVAMSVFIIFM